LAGEHAVLRGSPALAFPLVSRSLTLSYEPSGRPLDVEFAGENGEELKLLFYGVIENAMSRLGIAEALRGKFRLESSLPVGAGLGASAALCGAVARWCETQNWVPRADVYEFARRLEDLFHGESSGVDLAVSLSAQGIRFVRGGGHTMLPTRWQPKLFLSYCGQRGMTAECVNKVKRLFETDHERAQKLDDQMRRAVQLAESALAEESTVVQAASFKGLDQLKDAIQLARGCFEEWQLCGGDLGSHMLKLEKAGAIAVKPTGSGGGGFVLCLWASEPSSDIPLISCF
jgi:mevalonate kinase